MEFLTDIVDWFNKGINYYAVSLILFTLCVRLLVLPLDVKSRKGMRKMAKIQPKLNEIQKKYANDQAKMQRKQQELMQQEHYNPLSGCLPMLLQYPILILMFYAMRSVANREMARQILQAIGGNEYPINHNETFLWVKNLWTADSFFASIAPTTGVFSQVSADTWMKAFAELNTSPEVQAEILKRIMMSDTLMRVDAETLKAFAQSIGMADTSTAVNIIANLGNIPSDSIVKFLTDNAGVQFASVIDAMNGNTWEMVFANHDTVQLNAILKAYVEKVVTINQSGCSSCFMCALCGGQSSNYSVDAIQNVYMASDFYKNSQHAIYSVPILGNLYWPCNGFMVLACLSLASQILMTKLNPTSQPEQQPAKAGEVQKGAGTAKFLKYFFPIFSFYCCVSSYAAFALYWVASNLIMIGLTAGINKYLDKKEAQQGDASNKNTITGEGKIR